MIITDEMLYQHIAEARDIWLSTLPDDTELPEFCCSKAFEHKMRKILKERRRSYKNNQIRRYMKQTIAAVLAVAVLTFGGMMTVQAFREKVIEVVVHVFHELTDYRFTSNTEDYELPKVEFGFVPNGMNETEYNTYEGSRSYILYENSDGEFFELTLRQIQPDDDAGKILDTEDAITENFVIRGNMATVNTKHGASVIIWSEYNVLYQLYGDIALNDLKEIVQQLKIIYK